MKKLIAMLLLCCALPSAAGAQDWKDALTKIATSAADQLTDGKLTEKALLGTWNYARPGVKFEGGDIASEVAGAALESGVVKRLESLYGFFGLREGAGSFVFNDDKTFCAKLGKRELSGTYVYDAKTHRITLSFEGKIKLGTMQGNVYISGQELLLVFPATKLVDMLSVLGSRVSALSSFTELLDKYKNIYVGFAFRK